MEVEYRSCDGDLNLKLMDLETHVFIFVIIRCQLTFTANVFEV